MSTYYTSKYSGEQIDEAVGKMLEGGMTGDYADRQLSNLDTPQAALSNLGAGVRPNELDNPGLCVNQRGQESYTGNGGEPVTFDRWQAGLHTTIAQNGGNIVVSASGGAGYILQRLENPIFGKAIVFSVLTTLGLYECKGVVNSGGTITQATPFGAISVTHGARMHALIRLNDGQSITLHVQDGDVAKLEIGDTQTLAYQAEDGTWQLLPQPESDYATQLLRCQRYFFRSTANHYFSGCMYDASNGIFLVPYSVEMRTVPAVTVKNSGTLRFYDNTAAVLTAGNISVKSADGSGIKLLVSGVSGGKAGSATITDMQFDFSAEL